jgi:xanthine dehydrogenase small subunit
MVQHPSRAASRPPQDDEIGDDEYAFGAQVFYAPRTLTELLALRAAHSDALLLGGGTDLGLRVSKEREAFPRVISTSSVSELRQVRAVADAVEIGGAATYTEALPYLDRHFPAFAALVRRIGSRQIRNLGTLAGNLATASPIGDTLPCLIALGASVTLASHSGARTIPVEDFVTGYRKTELRADEVIAAIRIPFLKGEAFQAYKLSKRFDQDISTLVAAFALSLEGGRLKTLRATFGGMAARPMRAAHLEAALAGRAWSAAASLTDVDALIARDFQPLSDHRGGASYRLRAAAGLVRRLQIETTSAAPARLEAL